MESATGTERRSVIILGVAFAAVVALQVYLVFAKSINWDEFFHFQHIYQLRTGTLTKPLQVLYIHYFAWLFDLPFDPVTQLQVGRLFLLVCEPIIALAIFGLVRCFSGTSLVAAFCALAYVTGGYVFSHIFAFRPGAQATALLMVSLWLFARRALDWWGVCAIALFVAMAVMLTIKSGLYAPAFLGLFYWRLRQADRPGRLILQCAAIGLLAILFLGVLFLLHGLTVVQDPVAASTANVSSAANTVFSAGLFPQGKYLLIQMVMAPVLSAILVASPFLWKRRLPSVSERVALAGLLLPMATVVFYRNSYPYNFVFILAPASVTVFPAAEWLLRRTGPLIATALLMVQPILSTVSEPRGVADTQRAIIAAVHDVFPRPVVYVDFCGLVADFPRVYSFLTSGWGLAHYREAGQPLLVETMAKTTVPLVISDHNVLQAALKGSEHEEMLLPADVAALRENFVHHWGPLWVAGKRIAAGTTEGSFDVRTPGPYTVEGAPLAIDGRRLDVGDVVVLDRGAHRAMPDAKRGALLRWGDHLPMPHVPAPTGALYTEY